MAGIDLRYHSILVTSLFLGNMRRTASVMIFEGSRSRRSAHLALRATECAVYQVYRLWSSFFAGEDHLVGIRHDDVIARVDMRGIVGQCLPMRIMAISLTGGPRLGRRRLQPPLLFDRAGPRP